jgi:hypothetical protein
MAGSFSGIVAVRRGEETDLTLLQGATINFSITIGPDYTPADAALQARETPGDPVAYVVFNSDLGRVSVDGQVITFTMTAEDSAALPAGEFFYDMQIEDDTGATHRIYSGKFTVDPSITQVL